MASTLNSVESTSDASTAPTDLSDPQKPRSKSTQSQTKDRDLHSQIEDLLMALSDMQRQQADLSRELQQEREERQEDHEVAKSMLNHIKENDDTPDELISKAEERFPSGDPKRRSILQTKHQLRDDVNRWKEMHETENSRCLDLSRRVEDSEQENSSLKEQLREARARIQDEYRNKQRLEKTVQDLRSNKTAVESPSDTLLSPTSDSSESYTSNGLRSLKLVRTNSQTSNTFQAAPQPSQKSTTFNKRSSSLGLQGILSTENNKPASEEALLLELVNAKTAEAVARQELEEVKAKLDSLRKLVSAPQRSPSRGKENRTSWLGRSPSVLGKENANPNGNGNGLTKTATEPAKPASSAPSAGGFFSGWGRRAASGNQETCAEAQ